MKITKEELKKIAHDCADVEIYTATGKPSCFHTDYCKSCYLDLDELPEEFEGDYEIMNERDYNSSLCANSCVIANFSEWYGNKYAKVLCVLIY